jgi:hypothetical protein
VLLQVGLADFRLHLKPVRPEDPFRQCVRNVSEAGLGLGLQVFPGTIPEVDYVSVSTSVITTVAVPNSNGSHML